VIPPEYLNQIVTGDARVLAERIPDASVDLIFTDPVYSERPLYDWLGMVARRVLKPTGAVLCWSNGKWHHDNTRWLEDAGLTYRYDFAHAQIRMGAAFNGKIVSKSNRITWLDIDGRSTMRDYIIDGFAEPTYRLPGAFHWGKSFVYTVMAMRAFPGTVLDPFTGQGTVPAAAQTLGRNYIAFEIDPDTAARARARVEATQAMHPVFLEEQHAMELAS